MRQVKVLILEFVLKDCVNRDCDHFCVTVTEFSTMFVTRKNAEYILRGVNTSPRVAVYTYYRNDKNKVYLKVYLRRSTLFLNYFPK